MEYGILCLLPILIIIVLAIITRRGIESLLIGAVAGYIMVYGIKFFWPLIDGLYATMMDEDTVWILLVCAFLGSMTFLLEKSRGLNGLATFLMKWAKTPKKSLVASWVAGIIVFMDDYLNIFVVGALMKKVTDKNGVPREMLAYVVDSTAAPVCLIIPLSSWAVFFSVIIGEQKEFAHLGSGMEIYVHSIPFIFYAWLTLIVVLLVILGIIPTFGPMKKAYNRAMIKGKLFSDDSAKLAVNKTDTNEEETGNMWHFIIPVLVLIGVTVWQDDILIGLIAGNFISIVMILISRRMNFNNLCDTLIDGMASSMPLIIICAVAVFARGIFTELKIADFIIATTADYLSPGLFPALTFVIVAVLAFVTVSCWGMVAVAIPIIVPLSVAVGADPFLVVGAILAGSGFGSHACPFEDASVLTSQVTGISYLEHFTTQFPYALVSAGGSIVLFLICGFVM
ncbi:MAG: TRAP transporter large permease subunit [Clostridiaceae bacterium]|nr:TRAP transporter large permease subunit [Clostridiaceae bacterium]